ncbi:helix-turn-helix domain-containing protein [Streptomyces beihaiensis]|uniref:Helix-turn-helix transcriptional regulator n=1 Tax=Streptomyces beihaiensis TaxID=2984495 RepID=A0ABT3TZ47_9ACTN|nr:helix-turn-helix transcriptional regulator [Streptomyces beihaiensis]MCX3062319.1 helix-turn-helix transcriptional regulator [Streptomyces beihaiensis]
MAHIRQLDPSASPLDHFGSELRFWRETEGLSQPQLGEKLFCTASLIGQIETAHKVPTRDFAERLDAAFGTSGSFGRLVGLVLRSQLPSWFQEIAGLEAKATYISVYEAQVVYGLLQTEAYARAVLGVTQQDKVDERVAARLDRQRVLDRSNPPALWIVLSEAALRNQVGGREVMWNQLAHLLSFRNRDDVNIQVVPFTVGAHHGLPGTFTLMRFEDDPDIVYTEDFIQGHATANPEANKAGSLRYAHLQATALSVEESAAMISRVMEESYGEHVGPGGRGLA